VGLVRTAGRVWKARMHDVGNFQSRALLTAFYFTILAPFAMVMRLTSDPLQRRSRPSGWVAWAHQDTDVTTARRQY